MKSAESARVLIVDDEPDLREVLSDSLRFQGYVVEAAADGRSALDLIKANAFDLVITDVRMPGFSGVELLKRVRAEVGLAPAIALMSGFADVPVWEAYHLGAEAYLAKPFDFNLLRTLIGSVTASSASRFSVPVPTNPAEIIEAGSGQFSVGRGGIFLADCRASFRRGKSLALRLRPGSDAAAIDAFGVIRWVRTGAVGDLPAGAGIEITSVAAAHRSPFLRVVDASQTVAFIPHGFDVGAVVSGAPPRLRRQG